MKIVIQCAGVKKLKHKHWNGMKFVANPMGLEGFARPDDPSNGETWRKLLLEANNEYNRTGLIPDGLLPAWELYRNTTYKRLKDKFEIKNLFILSAGWGLVNGGFLLPEYNITFSKAPPLNKREFSRNDGYCDFNMLVPERGESVYFFGTPAYFNLYYKLTSDSPCKKIIRLDRKVAGTTLAQTGLLKITELSALQFCPQQSSHLGIISHRA
jgi:hypothetical protein